MELSYPFSPSDSLSLTGPLGPWSTQLSRTLLLFHFGQLDRLSLSSPPRLYLILLISLTSLLSAPRNRAFPLSVRTLIFNHHQRLSILTPFYLQFLTSHFFPGPLPPRPFALHTPLQPAPTAPSRCWPSLVLPFYLQRRQSALILCHSLYISASQSWALAFHPEVLRSARRTRGCIERLRRA